jgi:succinyl-CoA synthetase beta subunit
MGLAIPVVGRLEGTNVDEGKAILRESGLKITPADSLGDGARKAVEAAR